MKIWAVSILQAKGGRGRAKRAPGIVGPVGSLRSTTATQIRVLRQSLNPLVEEHPTWQNGHRIHRPNAQEDQPKNHQCDDQKQNEHDLGHVSRAGRNARESQTSG